MISPPSFSPPARGLIVAGSFALVVLLMESAASILAPLLLAVFIAIVSTPALRWMRERGVPKWGALALIAFILLDIGSLIALLATGALEGFRDSLPTYQERFMLLSEELGRWLESIGMANSREAVPDLLDPSHVNRAVSLALANASGIFATGFLVLLATIFMLLEAPAIPAKLAAAFDLTEAGKARIRRLLDAINRYMRIKSLTSLGTAACVWLLLTFMGIDFAILWALLAFFFNFVPVVGNVLMMIPAVLLALVQGGVGTAITVAIGYLVINTVIGNVLEPRIMGKGLGVSTLAVFVSLLFWGWLFGTVGMFLAVPLTAAVVIALDASPYTRPLAILLGPDISKPVAETQLAPKPEGALSTDPLPAGPDPDTAAAPPAAPLTEPPAPPKTASRQGAARSRSNDGAVARKEPQPTTPDPDSAAAPSKEPAPPKTPRRQRTARPTSNDAAALTQTPPPEGPDPDTAVALPAQPSPPPKTPRRPRAARTTPKDKAVQKKPE